MLLVYTQKVTERVRYTFELVLQQLLGIEYKLTDALEEWQAHLGPKMAYTEKPVEAPFWLAAHTLLFERGIKEQSIQVVPFQQTKAFFTTGNNSAMLFDCFAATFYMVSRYEEYLPFIKDDHSRFSAAQSIALKEDFLHQPVVHLWANALGQQLQQAFPNLSLSPPTYRFVPTYDIDIAWAYLHKGVLRNLGGFAKGMAKGQVTDVMQRIATLLRLSEDPYYTFDYLYRLQQDYNLAPIYFFLVGNYDRFDKNTSIHEPAYQRLIKHVADYATVGVHPSYGSNKDKQQVTKEKESIEDIIHRPVIHSRQHYLKLQLPATYQHLIDLDIMHDYTLGYTSHAGFRAGICVPYYFYNLHVETKTRLQLHPFALMDSVYQYYNQNHPREVLDTAKPIIDAVKAVGGTLYTLWHNNSFSETFEWKGWRKPYEQLIAYASQ